jgi:hypothetical protein
MLLRSAKLMLVGSNAGGRSSPTLTGQFIAAPGSDAVSRTSCDLRLLFGGNAIIGNGKGGEHDN